MRRAIAIGALTGVLLAALAAEPAIAATRGGGGGVPFAVLGIHFPSIRSVVHDVIKWFFTTFLDFLVPDFLREAAVSTIKHLVTIPDPSDRRVWPTLGRLSDGMKWIAVPLLSLASVAAWVQSWIRELSGRPAATVDALIRTALAAVWLTVYAVFFSQSVLLVNAITSTILGLPAVAHGLERTVGLVFAGALLSSTAGPILLALLCTVGVLLGVGLFLLDVGLLVLFAVLFVSGPFAIACSVVEETRGVWTAWRYAVLTAALVPIGWCILFATAGAFMLDVTNWSGGVSGQVGARFTGVFAAIVVLVLAVRWPLMLWSTLRHHIAGALMSVGTRGRAGAGGAQTVPGGRAARAALQRSSLRVGDAVAGGLGAARGSASALARQALARGGAVAAAPIVTSPAGLAVAVAGSGAVRRSTRGRGATPVRARAASAGVRRRATAARIAARRAFAAGASGPEVIDAAVAAATRPNRQVTPNPATASALVATRARAAGRARGVAPASTASAPRKRKAGTSPVTMWWPAAMGGTAGPPTARPRRIDPSTPRSPAGPRPDSAPSTSSRAPLARSTPRIPMAQKAPTPPPPPMGRTAAARTSRVRPDVSPPAPTRRPTRQAAPPPPSRPSAALQPSTDAPGPSRDRGPSASPPPRRPGRE
ncbi:MAG: hypothetical protein JWQ48_3435 [Conexibacter sp.]|nr:hypothetical protein [Conexibacter sp.]